MTILGRETGADVVVRGPGVSARHAYVEEHSLGRYLIRDLSSTNGTFVNGARISETVVETSDSIALGSTPVSWSEMLPALHREARRPRGLTVGRDPGNDHVIRDSRVSSRHAELVPRGSSIEVVDLGSSNGVYVNGRQIVSRALVGAEDRVRLGSLPIDVFAIPGSGAGRTDRRHPQASEQPDQPPPARGPELESLPSSGGRSGVPAILWKVAATLAFVLLLAGALAGVLYASRTEVSAYCEVGGERIHHETVFAWQEQEARRRASSHRWCQEHGDELITVEHISRCEYCGKVHDVRRETAPRREEPQGSDRVAGFCSDSCKALGTGRRIYEEGKESLGGLAEEAVGDVLDFLEGR